MPSIFEYQIAYVEDLSAFDSKRAAARAAGVKGLAIKLYDGDGNPLIGKNETYLRANGAALRAQGFSLGVWACPRNESVQNAASLISNAYAGKSFCVMETEWLWKSDGGGRDVADLLAAWRTVRPKAWTGFALEGGPSTAFNHTAVQADPYSVLCPENYWLQNAGYDVRACLERCVSLGWDLSRVKPTLTGVEGHSMAEAIIRCQRVQNSFENHVTQGVLLWRGDMLSDEDYRLIGLADNLALR